MSFKQTLRELTNKARADMEAAESRDRARVIEGIANDLKAEAAKGNTECTFEVQARHLECIRDAFRDVVVGDYIDDDGNTHVKFRW